MNNRLLEALKQNAIDAYRETNPASVIYGTVVSVEPLAVQISTKLTVPEEFLLLTRNVKKHKIKVDVEYEGIGKIKIENVQQTGLRELAAEEIEVTVHNELEAGDRVILLQVQGGQEYVVLDKIVEEGEEE